MESVFDKAFQQTVAVEGTYSNDPSDPGGETKYGIADARDGTVDGMVDLNADGIPDLKVKDLTLSDAKEIYEREYWIKARCDKLPPSLAPLVFDCAVNQGVEVSTKLLQRALNIKQDGVFGRNTLDAVMKSDTNELCALFMAERAIRYYGTRNFDRFGRGWLKRLFVVNWGSHAKQ